MQNFKKIKFINSFSKSEFILLNINKKLYLKKKIRNPKKRDYESILKNNYFYNELNINKVKSQYIDIRSFKDLKTKKYFLSEYINGSSGDLILTNLGSTEINIISNFIDEYFYTLKKKVKWVKFSKNIIINKLNNINIKTKIPYLKKLFFKNKKKILKEIKDIKYYPSGFCHGDLTLSNMIIAGDKIYLIDFLKTYNDGITQDLSKIFQEFILGWSSRKLNEREILRSETIYRRIIKDNFFNSFSQNIQKVMRFEVLMTILRIFPYVDKNDKVTINWLNKSLNRINNKNFFKIK